MWSDKDDHDGGSLSTQTCYQTYRFGDTTSEGVADRDVKYRHGGSFDRSLDDADEDDTGREATRAVGEAKEEGDGTGAGGGGTEGSSSGGASLSGAEAGGGGRRGRRGPKRVEQVA